MTARSDDYADGADRAFAALQDILPKRALSSANSERPGVWNDHGHDYRKELPALLRTAFGFVTSPVPGATPKNPASGLMA